MTSTVTEARQELEELLPWHAAGTLSRRDAARVEEALARDPELARRYALVQEELAGTIHVNESLGAPSARAMDKLLAAIDAEPATAQRRTAGWSAGLAAFVAGLSPRALAFAGVAAAVVIAVQAGLLVGLGLGERPGSFQTASGPSAVAPAEGSFALIRFKPQATAADITRFLGEHKLALVGGPLAGGMFRVKLAGTSLSKDEAARLARRLQEDAIVDLIATAQ